MQLRIPHVVQRLSNGLTVVIHEDHRTPIVAVNLWYFVGSKDERPGRTGFAHLFEHLMFEGSQHVPKGRFDELLENVGGVNNGSTSTDRTNYWETVPATALELALHLESDRMGWFAETITQEKLDGQREVVKNERRQSYDNQPYGLAWETVMAALYPADHPYHWPVIGWLEDLDAATLDDVRHFFATYYHPANAALAIAGDVVTSDVVALVDRYFGAIAGGTPAPSLATVRPALARDTYITLEDDVHLPRLYMAWHTEPLYAPGDAEMDVAAELLGAGKATRLYRRLVHDLQIAQDVEADQESGQLGSALVLVVTAREGVSLERIEAETRGVLSDLAHGVEAREIARARHHLETDAIDALQAVGGFGGKADLLNQYFYYTGTPDFLAQDLSRYQVLTPERVGARLAAVIAQPAVIVSVVPAGALQLAAGDGR